MTKLHGMKAQLQGVSMQLQTMKSTQAMTQAMQGATNAMQMMGGTLNTQKLMQIMRDFERQNGQMNMTQEMMGDAMDETLEVGVGRAAGGGGNLVLVLLHVISVFWAAAAAGWPGCREAAKAATSCVGAYLLMPCVLLGFVIQAFPFIVG